MSEPHDIESDAETVADLDMPEDLRIDDAPSVKGPAPVAAILKVNGEILPLHSPFNIGRSSKSCRVIPDDGASRRHALIQYNDAHHHWLITDLGSGNGTYLNGVRITQPETLKTGDEIRISDVTFTFEQETAPAISQLPLSLLGSTAIKSESVQCWLLIADVAGFTQLSQQLPQEELSAKVRQWAAECETIIAASGGIVNEYMGDALLAFWKHDEGVSPKVADALAKFDALESASGLDFRVIVHFGEVKVGGGVSSGREKLAGRELNFVHRMEKAAGEGGRKVSLTQAAADMLGSLVECQEIGEFEIKSFEGKQALYSVEFE